MSLWFSDNDQTKILRGYMPVGRIYKKAYTIGSNFYNIIRWQGQQFSDLVGKFNITFKGIFLCTDESGLLSNWERDYNIPNDVFYESVEFNKRDVFVLKYLMRGNTEWHFRAVANIYGMDVIITPSPVFNHNVIGVSFLGVDPLTVPYKIPHKLGAGLMTAKIKKIYEAIKPAQCKIVYIPASGHEVSVDTTDRIPSKVPHYLGQTSDTQEAFNNKPKPRINFCEGIFK